tara:strand:- start:1622 stop:2068 length:447 start_codon:yes stop_codon:yes gene_type:complete
MKALLTISALVLLAACAQPETADDAAPVYDADHLASSPACFADDRASLLAAGQTLLERGPDGIVKVSGFDSGQRENFEFPIGQLSAPSRLALDTAAAAFYQAAGRIHDVTTDAVIYHRATDGTLCTVTSDTPIGRPLLEAARALASTG